MLRRSFGSLLLVLTVATLGGSLAVWKQGATRAAEAASAGLSEPVESISIATAEPRLHQPMATAIGTVLALRSVSLRNELAGTVRESRLVPGALVEEDALLVALDVSVEHAELAALQAQATLAATTLARLERLVAERATSESTVDRARAERDVALAQIARTQALIERKTIRAPFRARVGLADVHPGQYLDAGTELTTLQSVGDTVHVDFALAQDLAAGLRAGDGVEVRSDARQPAIAARIVAVDARVDPETRNASVRARVERGGRLLTPGASVTVAVPAGAPQAAVAVPASALRRGPDGDHVFVIAMEGPRGRAMMRRVESGALLGDDVLVHAGLAAGEQVATSGAFKLRDGLAVVPLPAAAAADTK